MITLLLFAVSLLPPPPPAIVAPAFEVEISIQPSRMDTYQLLKRRTPDTFTCRARVREVDTHRGWGVNDLVVLPGQSDKTTATFGEYTVTFSVALKSQRAEADVTIKRGEQIVTRQRSTVYLKADEGIVPIR